MAPELSIAAPATPEPLLWDRYYRQQDPSAREEILARHAPLVRHIVGRMKASLVPGADRDDLESAGAIGLLKALDRYDPARNVKFDTFAYRWIQGSILDHLRRLDPLSRGGRRRVENYLQTAHALRDSLGREPTDEELAGMMRLAPEALRDLQWEVSHMGAISLEPSGEDEEGEIGPVHSLAAPPSEDALRHLERREQIADVKAALERLSEKERLVVALYYDENLTFREIGRILGVSESRVCQLHTRAVARIQKSLSSKILES